MSPATLKYIQESATEAVTKQMEKDRVLRQAKLMQEAASALMLYGCETDLVQELLLEGLAMTQKIEDAG